MKRDGAEEDGDRMDRAHARLAMAVAGFAVGVAPRALAEEGRGATAVTFGRQVAMYLCHVVFEMSLARVAAAFARDRSTAGHACHVVEERRDDPAFDGWIGALECALQETPQPRDWTASMRRRSA